MNFSRAANCSFGIIIFTTKSIKRENHCAGNRSLHPRFPTFCLMALFGASLPFKSAGSEHILKRRLPQLQSDLWVRQGDSMRDSAPGL